MLTQALYHWNQLQLRLLWAYEGPVVQPYGIWQPSPRPLSSISVLQGSLEIKTHEDRLSACAGDTLVIPAGDHAVKTWAGIRVRSVACEIFGGTPEMLFGFCQPLLLPAPQAATLDLSVQDLLKAIYGDQPSSYGASLQFIPRSLDHHAAVQSRLWHWFGRISTILEAVPKGTASPATHDPRVSKLLHLIGSRPLGSALSPRRLAAELGLSWRRLEQLFKEATRMTPSEYYDQRRIWAAYRKLASSTDTVKEIAYQLGFRQSSHFSRWFSGSFGMSPRQFRTRLKTGSTPPP